jgi:hypothetical protein
MKSGGISIAIIHMLYKSNGNNNHNRNDNASMIMVRSINADIILQNQRS